MSEDIIVSAVNAVSDFMAGKGWLGRSCGSCGRTFFTKPSMKDASICGWSKCSNGEYSFRALSKRKKILTPAQVCDRMSEHFHKEGYDPVAPLNVANSKGQTDLIIAGVQMFDGLIHCKEEVIADKVFVAQPCVRMQFQPEVASREGTSTSFVNVCTERVGVGIAEHLQSVDHWCDVLSKLGLHMNDFTIVMRVSTKDWGTGTFSALELFFSYGGLELGDAAYFLIPQSERPAIPISDIGFGLERVVWAVNKTDSYFDVLTPWAAVGVREMFDACRTSSLLLLCGIQAANKGPGLQFRRFAKVLAEKYYREDIYSALAFYFDYWTRFISPTVSLDTVMRLARLEIERFVNLKVCGMLRLPPPRDETTEAYLNRLVYTCGADMSELRKAIQTCKT